MTTEQQLEKIATILEGIMWIITDSGEDKLKDKRANVHNEIYWHFRNKYGADSEEFKAIRDKFRPFEVQRETDMDERLNNIWHRLSDKPRWKNEQNND